MRIVNHLNSSLLALGIGLAFQTTHADNTNALSDWVILPTETAIYDWGFPEKLAPLWNPSTNQVAEAMQRLPDYLHQMNTNSASIYTNQMPGLRERLPHTACQFVGITLEKRNGILINCFPVSSGLNKGWKNRFIKVYDSGPRWWSVIYLPDEKRFTQLTVDLGF